MRWSETAAAVVTFWKRRRRDGRTRARARERERERERERRRRLAARSASMWLDLGCAAMAPCVIMLSLVVVV